MKKWEYHLSKAACADKETVRQQWEDFANTGDCFGYLPLEKKIEILNEEYE